MTKEEQLKLLADVISESADSFFSSKISNSNITPDKQENEDGFSSSNIDITPDEQENANSFFSNEISNSNITPDEQENVIAGGTQDNFYEDEWEDSDNYGTDVWEDETSGERQNTESNDGSYSVDVDRPNVLRPDIWSQDVKDKCQEVRSKDELIHDWSDELVSALLPYATREFAEARERAYKDAKSNRQSEDKIAFKRDTCMVNGKPTEFTRVMQIPNWEMDLKDCLSNDDRAYNFDQIRTKITQSLYDYYGGFTRFNTIVVSGYQLIINGSCYMPKLSGAVIEKFPFDTIDYIKNGCIAPFFDWGYLHKMKNLTMLSFDDMDFVMSYVASDLGVGRDFNPLGLFKVCKSLNTLEIAGDVVTYPFDTQDTPEEVKNSARNIQSDAEYVSRFDKAYNVYTDKVCGTAGSVRKWTVNNLVNYANNRGNKNIFMYTGGILARTALSAVAGTGELALRATGGIVKGITNIVKGAVHEVKSRD